MPTTSGSDWEDFDGDLGPDPNTQEEVFQAAITNNPSPNTFTEIVNEAFATSIREYGFLCNLFSSLDQRVCIEVTTSLPLTHSALIEDSREKPDYSLGRFMINTGIRVSSNQSGTEEVIMHGPSTYELMNRQAHHVPPADAPIKGRFYAFRCTSAGASTTPQPTNGP